MRKIYTACGSGASCFRDSARKPARDMRKWPINGGLSRKRPDDFRLVPSAFGCIRVSALRSRWLRAAGLFLRKVRAHAATKSVDSLLAAAILRFYDCLLRLSFAAEASDGRASRKRFGKQRRFEGAVRLPLPPLRGKRGAAGQPARPAVKNIVGCNPHASSPARQGRWGL